MRYGMKQKGICGIPKGEIRELESEGRNSHSEKEILKKPARKLSQSCLHTSTKISKWLSNEAYVSIAEFRFLTLSIRIKSENICERKSRNPKSHGATINQMTMCTAASSHS